MGLIGLVISYVTFVALILGLAFSGRSVLDNLNKDQPDDTDRGEFLLRVCVYGILFALWLVGADGTGSWGFTRIFSEFWLFPVTIFEGIEKIFFNGQDINGFTERYHFNV